MRYKEKTDLTAIGNDPVFNEVLEKLTLDYDLTDSEQSYILSSALLLLKQFKKDNRFTSYADFAYSIILKYSLHYNDYAPLFDYSVNFGFYPIAKQIFEQDLLSTNLIHNFFNDVKLDSFQKARGYVETLEQHVESRKFLADESNEKSYLAPTSFGKSSLIIDYIKSYGQNLRVVIVVPTKSLLMQTYRMIREAELGQKIIIHDEMYNDENNFIAIFTQERSLRLLARKEVSFDVMFIDEAHKLLNNDSRSMLLSRLISRNRSLNINQKVIYLSPLINNIENVKVNKNQTITSHTINFNIKEPEIYEHRLNNEIFKYNRFVNKFYSHSRNLDKFSYLKLNSGNKNFLYNYRPIKIEKLASDLSKQLPVIEQTEELLELIRILKKEVHNDFMAIKFIKYGIIYIHGKLPDLIKEYLEYKFKTVGELKYIIANSVILEGMNLPIDTLFIFNTHGLKGKELTNLIGRVNRLNSIFTSDHNDLKKLQPKVHFINSEEYNRANSKMTNKISLLRSQIFEDKVENPLLSSFDLEKIASSKDNEEKFRKDVKSVQDDEMFIYLKPGNDADSIKIYLIENGFNNFYSNIDQFTEQFMPRIKSIRDDDVLEWKAMRMLDKVAYLFINISVEISDFEIERLGNKEAQNYYENHILISRKKSLKENIISQYDYFKKKSKSGNAKLYFGRSYGEETKETKSYPPIYGNNVYVDLSTKSKPELINLAIVKLKMEDDFINFKLNKFIVMLFDYKLITDDEYNLYVYGTTNKNKVELTKYGLNINLISRLHEDKQLKNIRIDKSNNLIGNEIFKSFINDVDDFYRFEISRYLS